MGEERMAYIAVEECGCATAAIVEGVASKSELAKTIAGYIKAGRVVEHVTVEQARERLNFKCQLPCPGKGER